MALLLLIVGPLAALRTPTDIFPEIRIPVIAVAWQYTGLPPDQMSGRIVTPNSVSMMWNRPSSTRGSVKYCFTSWSLKA